VDASQTRSPGADIIIEITAPGQAASRELARGILLGDQAVMVPDPPAELLRASSTVITVSVRNPASSIPPEVISVASMARLCLRDPEVNAACTVLRLSRPAQCVPASRGHSITQLVAALCSHQGSLWEVMSAFGPTSPAVRPAITPPTGAPEADGPWDLETDSPREFAGGICNVCHCCRPKDK